MPQNRRPSLDAIVDSPWALQPRILSRIVGWARDPSAGPLRVAAQDGPNDGAVRVGTVSVIPVYGVIENHSDWMCEMFGGTSLDGLREDISEELMDPSVRAVVLDIDSPGGTVAGMTEFAEWLRGIRGGPKPIVGVANTLCASAAAWLGFQCDELVATPSGYVGSVGVYAVHQEISGMLEQMGVTTTLVSAGPYKTEGNEFEPLTDAARADIQSRVDGAYDAFVSDAAAGRRLSAADVLARFGGGRVLSASEAVRAGMADRVATLPATISRLGRLSAASSSRARASLGAPDLRASAIPAESVPTFDGPWDPDEMERRCPPEESALRAANAWCDPEGDPSSASSYRLPHHAVSEDGAVEAASLAACADGVDRLNGDGAGIPEEDRAGVHAHLAAHLADAGREAAPLAGQAPFADRMASLAASAEVLAEHAHERARLRGKEGRPAFSTAIERSLRTTRDAIDALLAPPADPAPETPPQAPADPAPAARPAPPRAAAPAYRRLSDEDWHRRLESMNVRTR